MTKQHIVHLLEDGAFGGVTQNLKLFDRPEMALRYTSSIHRVQPGWAIAPKLAADIIVIHYSHSWSRLPFLWSLRRRNARAKIIHMEHSYSKEWAQLLVPNIERLKRLMITVSRNVDAVICVSHAQRQWLNTFSPKLAEKTLTINPYSDMSSLKALNISKIDYSKPLTIGTFGRFHQDKGFDKLITIFNQLPNDNDARLLVGGFGETQGELQALAACNTAIEFVGRVDDKAAFMQQCDVLIIPSKYETFGLTVAEAKAAGRAALVANVGALAEQVVDPRQVCDFGKPSEVLAKLSGLDTLPLDRFAEKGRADMHDYEERIIEAWAQLLK